MANLVLNRIQTPDGTILTSYHQHDFVAHKDANGLKYFVDGGLGLARRAQHTAHPYRELSVYDDDDFCKVRASFHWSIYGRKNDQSLQWIALSHLETPHIHAILHTQTQLPEHQRTLFKKELTYRAEHGLN